MKSIARWLIYGFLAAVAAAVAAFPVSDTESGQIVDPLAKAINDARVRFSMHSELLRREHSRELAREVKRRAPTGNDGSLYEIIRPSDVPAAYDTIIRRAADAMFGALPRRDSTVRVIIRLVLDTGVVIEGAPVQRARSQFSTDVFIPADTSDKVCAVIVRVQERRAYSGRRITLGADACYWYKTYGMPGRGMQAMIDTLQGSVLGDHARRNTYVRADASFFRSLAVYDVRAMGCIAAVIAACERLATERTKADRNVYEMLPTPGWVGYGRYYASYFDILPALLLTDIEREIRPARFREIWTANATFPATFAQVTGMSLGDWVYGRVSSRTAPQHGPLPSTRGWIVLLVAIPAFLAWGTWGVSRRSAVA